MIFSKNSNDSSDFEWEKCKSLVHKNSVHWNRCNKWVYKFDHHWKWLNNCIGYNNYKYFIILIWLYNLLSYAVILLWVGCIFTQINQTIIIVYTSWFLSIKVWITCFLTILLLFHFYLYISHKTTYEFIMGRRKTNKFGSELQSNKRSEIASLLQANSNEDLFKPQNQFTIKAE